VVEVVVVIVLAVASSDTSSLSVAKPSVDSALDLRVPIGDGSSGTPVVLLDLRRALAMSRFMPVMLLLRLDIRRSVFVGGHMHLVPILTPPHMHLFMEMLGLRAEMLVAEPVRDMLGLRAEIPVAEPVRDAVDVRLAPPPALAADAFDVRRPPCSCCEGGSMKLEPNPRETRLPPPFCADPAFDGGRAADDARDVRRPLAEEEERASAASTFHASSAAREAPSSASITVRSAASRQCGGNVADRRSLPEGPRPATLGSCQGSGNTYAPSSAAETSPLSNAPSHRTPSAQHQLPAPPGFPLVHPPRYTIPLEYTILPSPWIMPASHAPVYEEPDFHRNVPTPWCLPSFQSPSYASPWGHTHLPCPSMQSPVMTGRGSSFLAVVAISAAGKTPPPLLPTIRVLPRADF